MKPTKNRVFCPYSNKHKMVFETEKKALNHIRFNASDYEGKVPTRAYFCHACGGWHLTSKERGIIRSYKRSSNTSTMTYDEFVSRTQCEVLPQDFEEITKEYLAVEDNKDTFCRRWVRKKKALYIEGLVKACLQAGVTKTYTACLPES